MKLVSDRGGDEAVIDRQIRSGFRHVLISERPGGNASAAALAAVGRSRRPALVLCEFDRIKPTVAELRGLGGAGTVGEWGSDAQIVVAGYEKAGLYARFVPDTQFSLVLLRERTDQNDRSAKVVVERFRSAVTVEMTGTGPLDRAAAVPDVVMRRHDDGSLAVERTAGPGMTRSSAA